MSPDNKSNKMGQISIILAWSFRLSMTVACFLVTNLSLASQCSENAEDAARIFVQLAVEEPASSVHIVSLRDLNRYRARLEQLLNDKYSPMSSELREKLLGKQSTPAILSTLSDTELVGQYFAAGQKLRDPASVVDISVVAKRVGPYSGERVTLRYLVKSPAGESTQERTFSVSRSSDCWRLDVPIEAWARLEQMAKILKESRLETRGPDRVGRTLVAFKVAAASATERNDMRETAQRRDAAPHVWVSTKSIVTEADVVGATASWDCENVLGPEDAAVRVWFGARGARALRAWTEQNIGSMLAASVDGKVVTFAKVADAFGERLSLCLPGESLEAAEALANAFIGRTR